MIITVSDDLTGPAYGMGETEHDARTNATEWGFDYDDGVAIEITPESAAKVADGDPDAWEQIAE